MAPRQVKLLVGHAVAGVGPQTAVLSRDRVASTPFHARPPTRRGWTVQYNGLGGIARFHVKALVQRVAE